MTALRLLVLQQFIAACQGLSQFLLEVGMPALQIGQHASYVGDSTLDEGAVVIEGEVIVSELVVDADIVLLVIVRNGLQGQTLPLRFLGVPLDIDQILPK